MSPGLRCNDDCGPYGACPPPPPPPSAYTGNKVQLRGFYGSVREVDTAQVTLNIGGKDWSGVVALVEGTEAWVYHFLLTNNKRETTKSQTQYDR